MVSHTINNAIILAQGKTTLKADSSGWNGFDVQFDDGTITLFRVIGACVAVIWMLYALFQFSKPENKGGKLMDRIGGVAPLVVALCAVIGLFDMNKSVQVMNILLKGARAMVNAVTSAFAN